MKLFELEASLGLDTSDFEKGANDSHKKATSLVSTIGNKLSDLASMVGKGIAIGAGALATGFAAATKQAFDLTAAFEQNLGGVEAVFGEVAGFVQEKAEKAALNMGVSVSDYLSSVNKMGSLAQGAGFEVESSAKMATEAMQRAADVASVMGLSSERAMESVTGMFKGNFEMMDNLGVAINDAAIAEHALSLGIHKSTQEMSTQEKVLVAYNLFMEKTAKYAGNYRKENETLAGAIEVLHASWQNFLLGTDHSAEQLVLSVENVAHTSLSAVKQIVPRLWDNFATAAKIVLPKIEAEWDNLWENTLPDLAARGANFVIGKVNAVFGTTIPKIDSIDFPTFSEIQGKVNEWWHGSGDSVYEKLKNTLSWTFGELVLPAADETAGTIQSWWDNSVEPSLSKALQWAFFEITLPAWMDIVDTATSWWENDVKPSFEALTTWVLNPSFPSWEEMQGKAESWWSGIRSNLEALATFYATYDIKRVYSSSDLQGTQDWTIDTTGGATVPIPKASGLSFVPYDGYVSELHYGEAVLTRQQAEEYRDGNGGGAGNGELLAAINRLGDRIASMQVVMNAVTVGHMVSPTVSEDIAREAGGLGVNLAKPYFCILKVVIL